MIYYNRKSISQEATLENNMVEPPRTVYTHTRM